MSSGVSCSIQSLQGRTPSRPAAKRTSSSKAREVLAEERGDVGSEFGHGDPLSM